MVEIRQLAVERMGDLLDRMREAAKNRPPRCVDTRTVYTVLVPSDTFAGLEYVVTVSTSTPVGNLASVLTAACGCKGAILAGHCKHERRAKRYIAEQTRQGA